MIPLEKQNRFFSDPFQIWLSANLCCHLKLQGIRATWSCLFGIIAWRIWKNINLFIFQNISWTTYEIVKALLCWAQQPKPFINNSKSTTHTSIIQTHFEGNWVYLFTDGAVARVTRYASTEGVVRDQFETWLLGFSHYLSKCSPFEVEL